MSRRADERDWKNMMCPLCGCSPAYHFRSRYSEVAKCSNIECGHLFATGRAFREGVHEHEIGDIDLYHERNRRLVAKLVEMDVLKRGGRVLDIGAGLGHLADTVRTLLPSSKVACVEAAPGSITHLRNWGFVVYEDLDKIVQSVPFDSIFLIEVIEHFDDPLHLLASCRRLLAEGGQVFLTTPCGELRGGSHETAAYRTPEHVQFFTKNSLSYAAHKSGFSRVEFHELSAFHIGNRNRLLKTVKDSLRTMRNRIQGPHHMIATLA
jgi:2-polyprenyl-3-methyl-5-hydroxy-6-metoxy-1,4-benzoquinol methylase